ncbi:MAG: tetratricopeptide repeat protein, partial [Crocinitomicaceae bacterium]|nr:tetratricopeptide repeat protein [Crocinitomicaceae bacterium]
MSYKLLQNLLFTYLLLMSHGSIGQLNDSLLAYKYFRLFQEYEYQDTSLARSYADSGLYFARRAQKNELLGRAHQFKGWNFQDRSKFREANQAFHKSLSYFQKAKDKQGIADAYGNLGNSYFDLEKYQESLNYHLLSLKGNEKIIAGKPNKDALRAAREGRTYGLHNIGEIYSEIGMYDMALEHEYQSLKNEIKAKNKIGMAISYHSLAVLYKTIERIDSSIYYFEKAIEIYQVERFPYDYASTLQEYALLENSGLSEEKRKEMIEESLQIRKKLGDVNGEMEVLLGFCTWQFDKLSVDTLSQILEYVYDAIIEHDLETLSEDYFKLYSKYNARIGKFESAFFALEN